ncbi:MAG: DUF6106 family protein [Candidatus Borkfalkiaceae bacterium]|nr:DUF6106 family protein [Christensenellaceae bacterium]
MREIFYEESSHIQNEKKAKTIFIVFTVLAAISFIMMIFWFFMIGFVKVEDLKKGNIVVNIIYLFVPSLMFLGLGILSMNFRSKFYVDYDYTFVTGSVRFSKIIRNVKRKNICNFNVEAIEKVGKVDSETFNMYLKMPGIKKKPLTLNVYPSNEDFFYMVVNTDKGKELFILDCKEEFIATVLRYSNRGILEKDYK